MPAADDESLVRRWARRALTIPGYAVVLVLLGVGLPVLLPVAVVVDVARGSRLGTTRLLLFAIVFLASEVVGLAASAAGTLLLHGRREVAWQRTLQVAWTRVLFAAGRRLFRVRIVVEGDDAARRGPVVVLVRHASLADTLLPTIVLTHRHGLWLRFVLKRELLWDPCLDVVGHRLPNAFVERGGADGAREIARVRALATEVGSDEGVLLYPEGTRFTPAKRTRVLDRLATSDPERHARVASLEHVLPLRLGGALAALEAMPGADVLFVGHTGLEGATALRDLMRGALVGRTVRVGLWRVGASAIPRDRAPWLDAEWARMDAWVAGAPAVERVPDLGRRLRGSTSSFR